MKLVILVNDVTNQIAHQTTTHLLAAAKRRGHDVFIMSVTDFCLGESGTLAALAYPIHADGASVPPLVELLHQTKRVLLNLESCDALMIRTNPACDKPREWAHRSSLSVAAMLQERGVMVLNDPKGLALANNKLYLTYLPKEYRPQTMVSCDRNMIREFVESLDQMCVLKPLQGTWGRDVFFVHPENTSNLNQIIDLLTRDGLAMVQEFIPEAVEGDKRVVVMDGKILEADGKAAVVGRIPGQGELRSNIHAGGHAKWFAPSDDIREAVEKIGPRLVSDGIFLAGLDFVGKKLVEVNVYGIGGIQDMERFAQVSFSSMIIEAVEQKRSSFLLSHVTNPLTPKSEYHAGIN